jgi:ribosomal protein S12 methylthiotransferase accessory factor YcaO
MFERRPAPYEGVGTSAEDALARADLEMLERKTEKRR